LIRDSRKILFWNLLIFIVSVIIVVEIPFFGVVLGELLATALEGVAKFIKKY
jgi:hypothetical protein